MAEGTEICIQILALHLLYIWPWASHFTSLVCGLPLRKSQLSQPLQMETRINLMQCGHLNSTPCDRNTKNDSFIGCALRESSTSASPRPGTPSSAAQTLLSRLQLLLRSGCTTSAAVLVSEFRSHGKQASFFSNLHNTLSSIPGRQLRLPPPDPGNSTAWEAAKIHDGVGSERSRRKP